MDPQATTDPQVTTDSQVTTDPDPYFEEFLVTRRCSVYLMLTLGIQYFLYGLYVSLFTTFLRIRRRQSLTTESTLYFRPTVFLFFLATLLIMVQSIYLTRQAFEKFHAISTGDYDRLYNYLNKDALKTMCYALSDIIEIFINSTADYILIHRCYLIWSSRKRIGIPLAFLSVVTNALGFAGSIVNAYGISDTTDPWKAYIVSHGDTSESASMSMSVIVNSIITMLTAGRIWWVYRQARQQGGGGLLGTISRLIVESGLLFPTAVLVQVVLQSGVGDDKVFFDLAPSCYLITGLAIMLIVVRAQLGKTVENTMNNVQVFSTVQFAPREEQGEEGEREFERKGKKRE
ncbi:hypothetical protein Moror_5707 [Moniliophthora roreri MCA 2997]|uniref:Uncharacterized protein n=1 Tax=Moniliophthora roreri (strain MCA 2997) TaxID=1381753 RepID=V2Y6N7_MONRO|nr:hypothetical protein Moror_5707 [Moniliophthora roreri MCA 2997]